MLTHPHQPIRMGTPTVASLTRRGTGFQLGKKPARALRFMPLLRNFKKSRPANLLSLPQRDFSKLATLTPLVLLSLFLKMTPPLVKHRACRHKGSDDLAEPLLQKAQTTIHPLDWNTRGDPASYFENETPCRNFFTHGSSVGIVPTLLFFGRQRSADMPDFSGKF